MRQTKSGRRPATRAAFRCLRKGAPMIVSVLNQKGGVGKTTIAVNLAACFSRTGQRVLLIDADPQGSALAWSGVRQVEPHFIVVGMAKPTLHREVPALECGRTYAAGPHGNSRIRSKSNSRAQGTSL